MRTLQEIQRAEKCDYHMAGIIQEAERKSELPASPCSVERTNRLVIEHKLLTALDDKSKVAILATREDLEDMVCALESYNWNRERIKRCRDLAAGMSQLLREAFPPND